MNMNVRSIKAMNFTLERTFDFIDMIREQPALYNPKDVGYNASLLKKTIWEGVSDRFGQSVPQCKRAWRYLRETYARCRRQMESLPRSKMVRFPKNYRLYQKLSFLKDSVPAASTEYSAPRSRIKPRSRVKISKNPIVIGIDHMGFGNSNCTGLDNDVKREPILYIASAENAQKPKKKKNSRPSESDKSEEPELDIRKVTNNSQRLLQSDLASNPKENSISSGSVKPDQPVIAIIDKTRNVKKVLRKADPRYVPLAIKWRRLEELSSTSKILKPNEITKDRTIQRQHLEESSSNSKILKPNEITKDTTMKRRHLEESSSNSKILKRNEITEGTTLQQQHLEESSSNSKILKPNEITEDTTIPLFVEHAKEVIKRLPPLLQIKAKVEMFQMLTKYQMLALNGSSNQTATPLDTPTHMTNGSKTPENGQSVDISAKSSESIIKKELYEVKEDPDAQVELKPEYNVYDDFIECKEEELILP